MAHAYVPNRGQWAGSFAYLLRSGPVDVFLDSTGFTVSCARQTGPCASRGHAVRMTFEGSVGSRALRGERRLPGHHDYFLGNRPSLWRTGVPRFAEVRYPSVYPGIDVRFREADGVPEYDLELAPGADLGRVVVRVEGADGLAVDATGDLVIRTTLGPLTQPAPATWQTDSRGVRRAVPCSFVVLGDDRFGFAAPEWDRGAALTIDPPLLWSTYVGTSTDDYGTGVAVHPDGTVTLGGITPSPSFPTTPGAFDATHGGKNDCVLSRFDPTRTGASQLLYSTYIGGSASDNLTALDLDETGVLTILGDTESPDFPRTTSQRPGGTVDGFAIRFDPRRSGASQLVYSGVFGGSNWDFPAAIDVGRSGVLTIVGSTWSSDFPASPGAHDRTFNGGVSDGFVCQLDPRAPTSLNITYSTFLGGSNPEELRAVAVDLRGRIHFAGQSRSRNFPTTSGALMPSWRGGAIDGVYGILDTGAATQLTYSTYFGGQNSDVITGFVVEASGVVHLAGRTDSTDLPTTGDAYDRKLDGFLDVFFATLDPTRAGPSQLRYSTYLGGNHYDQPSAFARYPDGSFVLVGVTESSDLPTTVDAVDRTYNQRGDGFVLRLDPTLPPAEQVRYGTYLGGNDSDFPAAIQIDGSGTCFVAGRTESSDLPTTPGAYDTTSNGRADAFVTRLGPGTTLHADRHALPVSAPGRQDLYLDAGAGHAGRAYAVFGSLTGSSPGVRLGTIAVPLNPDIYTDLTIGAPNLPIFDRFRGALDSSGRARAAFVLPAGVPASAKGLVFHHAFLVFDSGMQLRAASNAVELRLE